MSDTLHQKDSVPQKIHGSFPGSTDAEVGFVVLDNILGKPGEQGIVWLAHAKNLKDVYYAVKISKHTVAGADDPAVEKFKYEVETLASFSHPNIVRVYTTGLYDIKNGAHPYYIMEYLGDSVSPLDKALALAQPIDRPSLIIRSLLATASALQHVHQQGICHRDIKSANILVGHDSCSVAPPKLIDFGFARVSGTLSNAKSISQSPSGPRAGSSFTRVRSAKTEENDDIWHLARVFQDLCVQYRDDMERYGSESKNMPIDFDGDYIALTDLLKEWGSIEIGSKPETEDSPSSFHVGLATIASHYNTTLLDPVTKGAIRYHRLPEIAMSSHLIPPYEVVRVPPHQQIFYPERIKRLISGPAFCKLRYTRQLGFVHLVYPGAQGTRFEHSLGVYNLACQAVLRLAQHAAFRRTCPEPKDALKFLLAGLLHDIGHYPYSHQLEEFSKHDFTSFQLRKVNNLIQKHAYRTAHLIESEYKEEICKEFAMSGDDIEDIIKLIEPTKEGDIVNRHTCIRLFRSLLDGAVDLDKLDYVERDAYHCGVPFGSYLDVDRLIESIRVIGDNTTARIVFRSRAVGTLEQIATARHQMYANVYWHHAVRSATAMFKHAFYLLQTELKDVHALYHAFHNAGSDEAAIALLRDMILRSLKSASSTGTSRKKLQAALHLINNISGQQRDLYKVLVEREQDPKLIAHYGEHNYIAQRRRAKAVFKYLEKNDFLSPSASELGEHNILIDCRIDNVPNYEDIGVLNDDGTVITLGAISPAIRQLKDSFIRQACKIRIFVNREALKSEYQDKRGRAILSPGVKNYIQT